MFSKIIDLLNDENVSARVYKKSKEVTKKTKSDPRLVADAWDLVICIYFITFRPTTSRQLS